MSKGYQLSQETHLVPVIYPLNITGGVAGQAVNMAKFAHVTFLLSLGVTASAPTAILVNACTDHTGAGATAIPFTIYPGETSSGTAGSDVLAAKVAATAAGYTPSANDNIFYVIELSSAALPAGSTYVQLQITAPAASIIASAVAVLSGGRYVGDQSGDASSSAIT